MNLISDWFKRAFSDSQVILMLSVLVFLLILTILFAEMLAPAIGALVIAFLLDGVAEWLKSKGLSHILAVSFAFSLFIATALITIIAIMPPLFDQIVQFANLGPKLVTIMRDHLLSLQTSFPDLISPEQVNDWFGKLGNEVANLGPRLLGMSMTGVASVMTTAVYMVLVPVMVFFFLKDKKQILSWLGSFLPANRPLIDQVGTEAVERAGDYARGKVYEIIIVGSVSFLVFQILGLRFATLLAVATGLSVIIPYIGAAVVTLPVALVAFFQWGMGPEFAGAIIAYLIIQALDGNLLAPLLFSEVVNLHPNAIIIAILIFGGIWGLWGVFFAIPLATVANAVIRVWRKHRHDLQIKNPTIAD